MPLPEQWLQRRPDSPAVDATQVAAKDSVIDLARPSRVSRQQLAVELSGRAVLPGDTPPRKRDGPRPVRRRDRPLDRAVAIATAAVCAFVPIRSQRRRELLGERDVQRCSNVSAELRFDLLTELQNRSGACASLLHGVPPSPLLTAICFGQQEVTPFCFFHKIRDTSP